MFTASYIFYLKTCHFQTDQLKSLTKDATTTATAATTTANTTTTTTSKDDVDTDEELLKDQQ